MRKATRVLQTLGFLLAFSGAAFAANTISWSPVTTYTDGTPITGKTVTYAIYWSGSSSLTSPAAVATGVTQTSRSFEPSALGMTPGSTVYFAMKTALSSGEVSGFSAPRSWVVPGVVSKTLNSISIGGPSSVNEGSSGNYTATASWSDGSSSAVTPTWSVSGSYASISSAGVLTAASVSANQTVTVNAGYSSGGVTKTASKSVTVVNVAPTLTALAVGGPASVTEGKTGDFIATASWSDGTSSIVSASWSVSGSYASISSAGVLTAASVSANQTVTVNAGYSSGGVTKTASRTVTIVNEDPAGPAVPGDLRIGVPAGSDGTTWRLSWAAVTTYADGQAIGAGRAIRYNAYWTRDPSLEAGNLVPLATSISSRSVDFQPLSLEMTKGEKIYFSLQAVLDTGKESSLSEPLPWRVFFKAPDAPKKGRIGYRGAVFQK
ncbi:MAG: hypothetical protein AB1346_08855 [Thermodesulfobacteriota bacterium]